MKIKYDQRLEYPQVIYIKERTGYKAYELSTGYQWHTDGRKLRDLGTIAVESIQEFIEHVLS